MGGVPRLRSIDLVAVLRRWPIPHLIGALRIGSPLTTSVSLRCGAPIPLFHVEHSRALSLQPEKLPADTLLVPGSRTAGERQGRTWPLPMWSVCRSQRLAPPLRSAACIDSCVKGQATPALCGGASREP